MASKGAQGIPKEFPLAQGVGRRWQGGPGCKEPTGICCEQPSPSETKHRDRGSPRQHTGTLARPRLPLAHRHRAEPSGTGTDPSSPYPRRWHHPSAQECRHGPCCTPKSCEPPLDPPPPPVPCCRASSGPSLHRASPRAGSAAAPAAQVSPTGIVPLPGSVMPPVRLSAHPFTRPPATGGAAAPTGARKRLGKALPAPCLGFPQPRSTRAPGEPRHIG